MKIMKNIVEHQVIAIFVFSQIFHQLRSVSAHSFDCLEHVHLPVLDHLLYASVCRAVHPAPRYSVLAYNNYRTIVCPLPPPLHHVHQLHQGIGGGGHLVPLGPAHQLEQLARLGGSLDSCHQLCEGHNLLVNLEYPGPDIWVMIVGNVLHSEDLAILL